MASVARQYASIHHYSSFGSIIKPYTGVIEKEIKSGGGFYDVVKHEVRGKEIVYYVIPDFFEAKLDALLNQYSSTEKGWVEKTKMLLKKCLDDTSYIMSSFALHVMQYITYCKYVYVLKSLYSLSRAIHSPPPNCA
jgi:hypothetical protein